MREYGNETIAVAMSGGVDSSVAAAVLKNQGYSLLGITMLTGGPDTAETIADAKKVCDRLGIEHRVVDISADFDRLVIDPFCSEYVKGRTPNPCVTCNRLIKFGLLLEEALRLGAARLATGHYIRLEQDPASQRCLVKKGVDTTKDQSYVLYSLMQSQLARAILPLGNYHKKEIRALAAEMDLPVADKPESQEICFIEGDYRDFLAERGLALPGPGPFLDMSGKVIGTHTGVTNYTIGQRRGLGIAHGVPLYVVAIDVKNNAVILGHNEDLQCQTFRADSCNFIPFDYLSEEIEVEVKIRYSARLAKATVIPLLPGTVEVRLEKAQRAVTPGQSVVFYRGDLLIGGGIIMSI